MKKKEIGTEENYKKEGKYQIGKVGIVLIVIQTEDFYQSQQN